MQQVRDALFPGRSGRIKFGRYTLIGMIGSGNIGEVYAAFDEVLARKVALKLIRPDGVSGNDANSALFAEAQRMARLSHPNVVHVYDVGVHEDQVFLSMEFIRGKTVTPWVRSLDGSSRRSRQRAIVHTFLAAGRGLEAAHRAQLIHGDIKPSNIMVGDDGRVRVLDFGLARSTTQTIVKATTGGEDEVPIGTPRYMAPEQFRGQQADEKSDQFSFCAALYEALYGTLPYPKLSASVSTDSGALGHEILTRRSPGALPRSVREALVRGLSVDPDKRFPNMAGLLARLENRPRNAVLALILAMLVGAFLTNLLFLAGLDKRQVCGGAQQDFDELWSGQRRAELALKWSGTGISYASEVQRIVDTGLDLYGDSWVGSHRYACLTRRATPEGQAVFTRRMTCLQRRLRYLGDVLDSLESIEVHNLARAPLMVAELPPPQACNDVETLMRDSLVTNADPRIDRERGELQRLLDRARIAVSRGAHGEAAIIAQGLVERAEALSADDLLAEALLIVGRTANAPDGLSSDLADDSLRRAADIGLQTQQFQLVIEAVARRVHLNYVQLSSRDPTMLESARFAAVLAESRSEYEFARVLLLSNMGSAYMALGDNDTAYSYFSQAVAERQNRVGPYTIEMLMALENFAMLTPDSETRMGYMAEVAEGLTSILGRRHPMTLAQRVHAASYALDPEDTYRFLSPTCHAYEANRSNYPPREQIRCLELAAFLAIDIGAHDEAIQWLQALLLHTRDDDLYGETHALTQGYLALLEGRAQEALDIFGGLLLSRDFDPQSWWRAKPEADAYLGLGLSEYALGYHARAAHALEEALSRYEELTLMNANTEHERRLAWTRFALARSLWLAPRILDTDVASRRIDELLAQATEWYERAGYRRHGYRWRTLDEWRQAAGQTSW